jgi:4-amino-4-deoxy-L-arabinose transferase-like glycosyltransferase
MDKKGAADRIIFWLSLLMIVLGGVLRLVAYLYNRSLFLDEAYLASSVIQRGYDGLLQVLDFYQGAPVGFLWLVKTCVYLFGPSEYSLRLVSMLAGFGSIALFYIVLKDVFQDPRPYIGTAFFATIPFMINYSIEFKPYMLDVFLTLLSVYMFSQALKQKIRTWALSLYCIVVLWFSYPAIFVVAAFCLLWFGYSLLKKQKDALKVSIVVGIFSLASFGLYLGTVYRSVQTNLDLSNGFFDLIRFPLLPHRLNDLRLIYQIGMEYLTVFGIAPAILLGLVSGLALFLLWDKKRLWFLVFFGVEILLLFVASWMGRFPMIARYLLFIVPLHIIFVSGFLANLWNQDKWKVAAIVVSVLFAIVNFGSIRYFLPQNVYRPRDEINPILTQLETMDESIPLYLYAYAIAPYEYKTGYKGRVQHTLTLPAEKDNVIYGSPFFDYGFNVPYSYESTIDPVELNQNLDVIESHDQIYILFVMYDTNHRDALINALDKSGSVQEVMNVYDTLLYLYRRY